MPQPDADRPVNVSVVICTRNRGANAADALNSILRSDAQDMEVILIDQSTNPETKDAVERFFRDARFRYVASTEVGTGRARNMGLRVARGKYVLYTDDDCEVADNWVQTMTACFDENERVAVVFCNVEPAPFDSTRGFVPTYVRDSDLLVTTLAQKCKARGIGAGMAVRRQAALDAGGFDALLGPGTQFPGCEDGDVAVRALLRGHWVYETSKTHVVHDGFRTWQEGKQLARRNWTGIGAAYCKPLRCGYWKFGVVVAYEAFVIALLQPASLLLKFRRPQGLRGFLFFWEGFIAGWRAPIDRDTVTYRDEGAMAPSKAALEK